MRRSRDLKIMLLLRGYRKKKRKEITLEASLGVNLLFVVYCVERKKGTERQKKYNTKSK